MRLTDYVTMRCKRSSEVNDIARLIPVGFKCGAPITSHFLCFSVSWFVLLLSLSEHKLVDGALICQSARHEKHTRLIGYLDVRSTCLERRVVGEWKACCRLYVVASSLWHTVLRHYFCDVTVPCSVLLYSNFLLLVAMHLLPPCAIFTGVDHFESNSLTIFSVANLFTVLLEPQSGIRSLGF